MRQDDFRSRDVGFNLACVNRGLEGGIHDLRNVSVDAAIGHVQILAYLLRAGDIVAAAAINATRVGYAAPGLYKVA